MNRSQHQMLRCYIDMQRDGWAFVVEPLDGNGRSRLIARTRISGRVAALGWGLLIEFLHFLMERRMLKGIKERARELEQARAGL